ncbi:MAG: hypothetical protein M3220_05190, partial [Chloroflexota bacterium]|nr:hypothetical protein [Chloroflexota bacterium]
TDVTLTASASDTATGGSTIAAIEYNMDAGSFVPMAPTDGSFDSPSEAATAALGPFASAGVHNICARATDTAGNVGAEVCTLVAVYDPSAGFITGGGWIDSPLGAYAGDPLLEGKANFGFVSKYKKGATTPDGQTQFQFHAAGFTFHSTSYAWLVISGPKAQYKGAGTVNGSGDYGFLLTANDGQVSGGGGIDKFRLKVWDKATNTVVYDNQLGATDDADATDAIEGGSIVIHTK